MKNLIFISAIAIGIASYNCHRTDVSIATDSISTTDSITIGDSHASVCIAGQYPSSHDAISDSIRLWIATAVNHTASYTGEEITPLSPAIIADGQKLIDICADSLMTQATRDFTDLMANSYSTSYEYDVKFGISYTSSKITSCYCTSYGYQGGAHGGTTAINASFRLNDGLLLDYDNTFTPQGIADLIDILREEIWKQYFEPDCHDCNMADVLLINPLELKLPATLPLFGPDGITFTYQQYEIAPYAAGMPSCTIPYDTLRPLMHPDIATLTE